MLKFLIEQCEYFAGKCRFAEFGCDALITKKNADSHYDNEAKTHLALLEIVINKIPKAVLKNYV